MFKVTLGKTSNEYQLGNVKVSIGRKPTPFGKLVLVIVGIEAHIFTLKTLEDSLVNLIEEYEGRDDNSYSELISFYTNLFPVTNYRTAI